MSRHPSVKWAQRPDKLYITIDLPDAQDVKLKLEPEGKFLFSATSGVDKVPYELDLDLFDKVDVNESKASVGLRNIRYLIKKNEDKWWSRLLKQAGKPPVFLKVDWDKWVDEDEEHENNNNEVENDMDFGDLDFSKLNMGGGGEGFDGLDGNEELDGLDSDADDDDEDDDSDTDDDSDEQASPAADEHEKVSSGVEPTPKA
ncbi:co-chaperone protein p23-1-like [Humulus lupulus]|uniref:co-chaperone protein p23-1-like n=1 Tax=Humulus lupulus TaxID=3486 RepID=UPI002B412EDE|nr:co-chaperone protein p23-1-like [Humulus lupulus]